MADIGWAVDTLRQGILVQRQGWNGKGMYLAMAGGGVQKVEARETADALGVVPGSDCTFLPYVMIRTVDGSFVPWICSQTDLLSKDWQAATVDIPA